MPAPTLGELPSPPSGRTGWPWTEAPDPIPERMPDGRPWPRVSVVTPSFNQIEFIEETIRSVLLQGYPDLEYIVMDGGSTDGSAEVIRRYSQWLAHWRSAPDKGQSDAINSGWARATGVVAAWLNSDDVYRPGCVGRAAAELMYDDSIGLVYGCSDVCDRYGQSTGTRYGREFVLEELTQGRCPIPQPSAFFRRAALEAAGPLDASLHFTMDADLWLRLAAVSGVHFVDEVWSDFRYYAESKSGQGRLRFEIDTYEFVRRGFERSLFPADLQARKEEVLARLMLRIAMAHYRQGQDALSRATALRAIHGNPAIACDRKMLSDLTRCMFGRTWIERLKALGPGGR